MIEPEAEAIVAMLEGCEDPPEVESLDLLEARTGEHKPALESSVVRVAPRGGGRRGERLQGSKGNGRECPKAMVPSAHDGDGDGDGVVCER